MASRKIPIDIPLFLVQQTDTVEGTVHLKQTLAALFTVFFQSGMFDTLTAVERDFAIQLQQDLNALVDSIFVDRVNQKASKAGAVKSAKRARQ